MKWLCKFLISFAILAVTILGSKVLACFMGASFEKVYSYVSSFFIGSFAAIIADWIIDKITDKHEQI